MRATRLIKKSLLYLIGNLSSKFLIAILVPIYAFYVSSSELGYYDYTQTVMYIVVPIVFVAIWESILKFILDEDDLEIKGRIISTSACFTFFILLIILIFAFIINHLSICKIDNFSYIILMLLAYAIAQIWQYYARSLQENKIYVVSGIISTIVNFLSIVLFICIFKVGISGLFISYIVGQIIIIIAIEFKIHIIQSIKLKSFDFNLMKKMLFYSAPLVMNLVSLWAISGFGRIIITNILGKQANGLYTFANKFGIVISTLGSVISMALIEEAILKAKDHDFGEYFSFIIQKLFQIFLSIGILAIPIIALFYHVIIYTDYYKSEKFFPLLLLYSIFLTMSTNIGSLFQVINKTSILFITTLLGAACTIVLAYLTIGRFGILGVVIAQISGALVMLISRWIIVKRYMKLNINLLKVILLHILFIVIATINIYLSFIGNCIFLVVSCILISYINQNDLKLFLKSVKDRFALDNILSKFTRR